MEDILVIILQFIFELIFQILANTPGFWIDWPSHNQSLADPPGITPYCFAWFIVGCIAAVVSLAFFKHTLISVPALRIANLITAPVISAFVAKKAAKIRERSNPYVSPRAHFWQAFWFTLALVAIRFAYVKRV